MSELAGKSVLLAVSGSVAFYKAFELLSLLKKEGARVRVALSRGALKFSTPLGWQALADELLCDFGEGEAGEKYGESWAANGANHISFSRGADLIILAPASASAINKLASGISDNLLTQTLLAAKAPLLIAPAMNTQMFLHFSTQNSLRLLAQNGAIVVGPVSKLLACGEEGMGGLAEPRMILYEAKRALLRREFWRGRRVVISGGGTREKIDEVRCISNFSSGKMALALAWAFYFAGAEVFLAQSFLGEGADLPFESEHFESSKELKKILEKHKNADFLIMAAAVSDFVPNFHKGKLKKDNFKEGLSLKLEKNEDLLAELDLAGKKIGFKMEIAQKDKEKEGEKLAIENAKKSFIAKKLDLLCLNILGEKNGFGSDENELIFMDKKFSTEKSGMKSKSELARELVRRCEGLE